MTDRLDAPGPMRRRGPRPLALHLSLSVSRSNGSAAALPNSSKDQPPGPVDASLIRGIAAYRRHPYQRALADPPVLWAEGSSRVLDYGGDGPAMFVVPSLINRAYVLDLAPERSMMRFLAANGVRALLLDWGWPSPEERCFTLTDYIAGRLERALEALPAPAAVAGYCMGGLLSLAAALRRPDLVRGLVLLATPWDFHAADPGIASWATLMLAQCEALLAKGTLPVDALSTLFALQDPAGIAAKYRAFGTLDQDSERARMFVALEDWLSDGVPLPAPVARECLGGWYAGNTPVTGTWRVAGQGVNPVQLRMPCLVAVPAQDRIVPPQSAGRLAHLIPAAVVLRPAAGHVGMIAGAHARKQLWEPLLGWLRSL